MFLRFSGWMVALTLTVLMGALRADEEKVPLDKLPAAVVDAVKTRFPGAKMVGAEKETEGGKTSYEVAIEHKGHKIDLALTADGTITEMEKQIEARELPSAAADALAARYPKATYKTIEEVIKVKDGKEKLAYYEILLVTAEKKKIEVTVTAEGKLGK